MGCFSLAANAAVNLPIYFEENHLGSFHFFATHAPLDQAHTLVLIDAHSDASAVPDSDRLRAGLRRVHSRAQRERRILAWRREGVLQPFNWIEPLMPRPIECVLWMARSKASAGGLEGLAADAREHLDSRVELGIMDREAGLLGQRFEVVEMEAEWARHLPADQPILVSIDLDFFSGKPAMQQAAEFHGLWQAVLDLPDLRAVTFALSRPWLVDDEEAQRLFAMAFEAAFRVANATVLRTLRAPRAGPLGSGQTPDGTRAAHPGLRSGEGIRRTGRALAHSPE